MTTVWTFAAMAACTGLVLLASAQRSLPLFFVGFVALFVFTGVGNGSVYKMIPSIFTGQVRRAVAGGADPETAAHDARRMANAVIGIAAAVGAGGGVLVNVAFRQSFLATGNGDRAISASSATTCSVP